MSCSEIILTTFVSMNSAALLLSAAGRIWLEHSLGRPFAPFELRENHTRSKSRIDVVAAAYDRRVSHFRRQGELIILQSSTDWSSSLVSARAEFCIDVNASRLLVVVEGGTRMGLSGQTKLVKPPARRRRRFQTITSQSTRSRRSRTCLRVRSPNPLAN